MKVIGINGSARVHGNTAILLSIVFEELEKQGVETEMISFGQEIIHPCKACFACGGKGNCVHHNDDFTSIFEKLVQADGILLASPSYSADVSANMKACIERAAVVADMNPKILKHKAGASISVARRAGALSALDTMHHFFLNHEMFVVGSTYWNIAYGQMPGDVLQDEEGIANMKNLGKNMAFLLKRLSQKEGDLHA